MPRYIIASGWWCGDDQDDRTKRLGSEAIRSKEIHSLWSQCTERFASPEEVLVIDSHSPIRDVQKSQNE